MFDVSSSSIYKPLAALLLCCTIASIAGAQTAAAPAAQPLPPPPPVIPPVQTSITVTGHLSMETPADVTDVSGDRLADTPGINLDDRLRQIPGFSLYKRTSSEVANPTTQGVSLRGIGSTGASRSLVMFDGVPVNDPFGGWVYWTRFTPDDLDRVEISRGASTSVFGNLALGGAIDIFPREATTRHVSAGAEAGTQGTYDLWADYTEAFPHFAITGAGRGFTTDGYYVVPESIRGTVDRPANVRFVNDTLRVDGYDGPQRLYVWFNSVVEERGNGTGLTHNSTAFGTLAARYQYAGTHDMFSLTGFADNGQFHSTYSSVAVGRNSEALVSTQTVPESAYGGSAIYTHTQQRVNVSAGADVEQDHGFSTDRSAFATRVTGGTLLQHGEFIQTDFTEGPVRFFLGARDQFTGRGHRFLTPSGGLAYAKNRWRARGSAYHAYREPTLNELYRQFRVGNTTTLANSKLQPETLLGVEVGADYVMERGAIRITAFHNDIHSLVQNATLSATSNSITRMRENSPEATGKGIEVSATQKWGDWSGDLEYLFADSQYVASRLRVAEVPRSQGSATLIWSHHTTLAAASVRSSSSQFDDDQNNFLLPGFAVVQLMVKQQLIKSLSATFQATNLLDRMFYTGYTPYPTIGDPRIIRGGLVWKFK